MVVDLADAAPTVQRAQVAFYTDYDGATLGTKSTSTRFVNYKRAASGTTATDFVYWWCSVSKEHLFIMLEGPRAADANPDDVTYGSLREYMFISSLTPYFTTPTDPTPCAIAFASRSANIVHTYTSFDHKAIVTKTVGGGQAAWGMGSLCTLAYPSGWGQLTGDTVNRYGLDGNQYLGPYVYFDDVDGMRGRLSSLFYGGPAYPTSDGIVVGQPMFTPTSKVTYGGQTYKWLVGNKTDNGNNGSIFGPLGGWFNSTGFTGYINGPLIAVPST